MPSDLGVVVPEVAQEHKDEKRHDDGEHDEQPFAASLGILIRNDSAEHFSRLHVVILVGVELLERLTNLLRELRAASVLCLQSAYFARSPRAIPHLVMRDRLKVSVRVLACVRRGVIGRCLRHRAFVRWKRSLLRSFQTVAKGASLAPRWHAVSTIKIKRKGEW